MMAMAKVFHVAPAKTPHPSRRAPGWYYSIDLAEPRGPFPTRQHAVDACQPNDPWALVDDLWWFIENVTDEDPTRNERFFKLRERVRTMRRP